MPAESKILNHPDREEIIKQLLDGISTLEVHKWLNNKYPDEKDKHLRMTVKTLSDFRKNYLNVNQEAAKIIRREKIKKDLGVSNNSNIATFIERPHENDEQRTLRIKEALLTSKTYREKLGEVTDAAIDAPRLMKEVLTLVESRIEVYYDKIAGANNLGEVVKEDKMMLEYIRLANDVIKDSKKIWDDYNSIPDDGNVDFNIVNEQVGIIRDIIKELLGEFDSELALEFIDRLNKRMNIAKYETNEPTDILEKVGTLRKKIKGIKD